MSGLQRRQNPRFHRIVHPCSQERNNHQLNRRLAELHYLHSHPHVTQAELDALHDHSGNGAGAAELLGYPLEGQQQYRIVTVA